MFLTCDLMGGTPDVSDVLQEFVFFPQTINNAGYLATRFNRSPLGRRCVHLREIGPLTFNPADVLRVKVLNEANQ